MKIQVPVRGHTARIWSSKEGTDLWARAFQEGGPEMCAKVGLDRLDFQYWKGGERRREGVFYLAQPRPVPVVGSVPYLLLGSCGPCSAGSAFGLPILGWPLGVNRD